VVGGGSDGSVYSSAEVYSPATNAFSLGNSLTAPRRDPAVAQLSNGKYLVAGGDSGGGVVVASAELFDPATGVFLPTGKMSVPRVHAAAVPLGNGRALLAAGANVLGAEVFDAAKGTFAPAGSLLASRQWPIGARLPGGDALIAGGMDDVGNPLATAERFDSATAQFVAAGAMQWERAYATAMALPSGLVFVTGGGGGFPMPFSELFDASTCTTDTNFCPADSYCAADGACKLRKVLGSACNLQQNADCKVANCRACAGAGNGNCVDGVCCDSACAGACDSCNQASKVGTCTPAPKGDPGNNPACVSNLCDGVLVTCPTTCASDGDCVAADYCSKATNKCTPRLGNGLKCDESAAGDCKVPGCHLCASGNCVNGYCCDSACGPCGSCSQVPGTCTPKAHGIAPDNPGCGEYYCDGVHGSCPANCVNVSDCKPGDSCVSGVCGTTFPNGTACVSAAQCTTGNCADGVCCNDPCVGTCQACSAKLKQSGADDGLCGPATVGTNPRQMCKDDGKECGKRAACAGDSESCAFVAQGTKCGAGPHCSTGDVVDTQCDGQGTCGEITKDACAPYQCQSAACTKPCAGDGDCVDGYFCKSKTCVKRSKNGDQCGDSSECLSKHCSPDGVCCNEACSGQCESCIESGQNGVCVAVAGEPRKGHGDCGSGECRGTCKPGDRTQCAYPGASLKCGDASSCSGNVVHARGVCTNDGTCDVPDAKPCPGSLRCDEVNGICKTACDTSADCISGSSCNTETHECAPTNGTCADTFTKKLPDGSTASCMGYRCNAGECASTCAKASECDVDNGYTCASGQCTKAGAAQPASGGSGDSGASGGCGVARGTSGRGDGYSVMLGMMALALVAARRRRAA
jgi:MYXO-CTERM domain-containing protein